MVSLPYLTLYCTAIVLIYAYNVNDERLAFVLEAFCFCYPLSPTLAPSQILTHLKQLLSYYYKQRIVLGVG
jgi:hypothetical protein